MSEQMNLGYATARTNPYVQNLAERLAANSRRQEHDHYVSAWPSQASFVAQIVADGTFGSAGQRREILGMLEVAYEADSSGPYDVVAYANASLRSAHSCYVIALERNGNHNCFGGSLNLYNSAEKNFVDTLPFRLDVASGKLLNA